MKIEFQLRRIDADKSETNIGWVKFGEVFGDTFLSLWGYSSQVLYHIDEGRIQVVNENILTRKHELKDFDWLIVEVGVDTAQRIAEALRKTDNWVIDESRVGLYEMWHGGEPIVFGETERQ